MQRLFIILLTGLALAACQQTSDLYGKGPLILNQSAVKHTVDARAKDKVYLESVFLAVDKQSRRVGYTYCPGEPQSCIDGEGVPGGQAVALCNRDGSYDCALYAINETVVWDGPVYLQGRRARQAMPYNGKWPFKVTQPSSGSGELIASEGRMKVRSSALSGDCQMSLSPTTMARGDASISCKGGLSYSGTFRRNSNRTLTGSVKSPSGPEIRFEIDMNQGTGNSGKPLYG